MRINIVNYLSIFSLLNKKIIHWINSILEKILKIKVPKYI